MYLLLAFTVSNMLLSAKRSNFTLVIFKAAYNANPSAEKNGQDQVHTFQKGYFESSQIHQLTIMYRFERTNHGIHLNFCVNVIRISNIFYV